MAKSGSTQIEFSATAYLVAAILTAALAVLSLVTALSGVPAVFFLTAFWAVICALCIRGWQRKRTA